MSAVWKYFTVNSDKDVAAKCNICHTQVSRGGTEPGRFYTSNLIAHLKKYLLGKIDCLYRSAYIGDFLKSDICFYD